MRSAAATIICCLMLNAGLAQVNPAPSLRPTPLEAFAARPTARVTWSKVIGRLESPESRATITALVVADETGGPGEMRGVRVDLAHVGAVPSCDWKYEAWRIMCRRPDAAVYVEQARLGSVRDSLKRGAARLRPMEFISGYSANAAGRESTGLIVCGYQFSGRRHAELAELLARAIAELKAAPR